MSTKNLEREDKPVLSRRSPFLFFFLVSGLAVFAISMFVMISSLYSESVNLPSVKTAFSGVIASSMMIAISWFLREQETKRLAETNKKEALEKLAVGVVHDFNNILACFETYATFLSEDLDNDTKQHEFAVRILEANGWARELVSKVHDNPEIYEEEA